MFRQIDATPKPAGCHLDYRLNNEVKALGGKLENFSQYNNALLLFTAQAGIQNKIQTNASF